MPAKEGKRKKIFDVAKVLKELQEGGRVEKGFRVLITGKGGAGKTTSTAILSRLLARKGYKVLAVDEDPQMNLPFALGIPEEEAGRIVPLTRNLDYIEEKVGARPGAGWGLMLRLNPEVDDVVDRFGIRAPDGIRLLVMGTVVQAATGCLCPENALLDAVVHYINLREKEVILMDTQAGVEHFGRAIAKGFRQAVVVTDVTFNSMQVALHAARLARELGIPYRHLVLNRLRSPRDVQRARNQLQKVDDGLFTTVTEIPFTEELLEIEPDISPIVEEGVAPGLLEKYVALAQTLEKYGEE